MRSARMPQPMCRTQTDNLELKRSDGLVEDWAMKNTVSISLVKLVDLDKALYDIVVAYSFKFVCLFGPSPHNTNISCNNSTDFSEIKFSNM